MMSFALVFLIKGVLAVAAAALGVAMSIIGGVVAVATIDEPSQTARSASRIGAAVLVLGLAIFTAGIIAGCRLMFA